MRLNETFLECQFVLAVSSLLGGISMLPGCLGVADASVAGMLLMLVDDEQRTWSNAAAATIIRFATLRFPFLVGFVAIASLGASLHSADGTGASKESAPVDRTAMRWRGL
jgi:uncharacterized membrane protein YbhN (UPF0104 family)